MSGDGLGGGRWAQVARAGGDHKLLIGVVHLAPLPGSPRYAGGGLEAIASGAIDDARALVEAGFDGYVVENFGDAPFFRDAVPPYVLTAMTAIIARLPRPAGPAALVGANVLRNDARGALAIAAALDLDFVRCNVHVGAAVTDQGIIEGDAARVMREQARVAPGVALLADVDVKHAQPLGRGFDLAAVAAEAAYRGLAAGLIVTGQGTGRPARRDDVATVRAAVPDQPVLVGSGVDVGSVGGVLEVADGVIVGTSLKRDGRVENEVDPRRAAAFVEAARDAHPNDG